MHSHAIQAKINEIVVQLKNLVGSLQTVHIPSFNVEARCCQYNTIRFILDEAYESRVRLEQHLGNESDWGEWFAAINRMFKYQIPDALLKGLLRKGHPVLTPLCLAYSPGHRNRISNQSRKDTAIE